MNTQLNQIFLFQVQLLKPSEFRTHKPNSASTGNQGRGNLQTKHLPESWGSCATLVLEDCTQSDRTMGPRSFNILQNARV